jgi:plastocyanin
MKFKIIFLSLVMATAFYSCGKSSSTPTSNNNGTPAMSASVSIQNFAFSPATVRVLPGGTVTWTNMDSTPHTATDVNGNFDSGSLNTSQTFKFTFPKAGTYTYHCSIHSMMANATVVVGN